MLKVKNKSKDLSRRGRPPADQIERRNEALLDAATEVFFESGFAGAKMNEIAKKAGASMETLYARYATKADLFAALIERKASHLASAIGPLSPDLEPREALTHYALQVIGMMSKADTRQLHRIVIAESIEAPELGAMFWESGPGRGFKMVGAYLDEQNRRGALNIPSAHRSAGLLTAMLVGGLVLRSTLGLKTMIESQQEQRDWATYVVDNFLRSLS